MADFKAITTQEEFDAALGPRLKRERETVTKELEKRIEEANNKAAGFEKQIGELGKQLEEAGKKTAASDKTIAELQGKVKGYETSSVKMRIAHETGIPYELAGRLSGETEDDIRKDAQTLSKIIGVGKPTPPLKDNEPAGKEVQRAALKSLTQDLVGKGE